MQEISSSVISLSQLFSVDKNLRVPPFQRQYAWSLPVASGLLHDLMDAFENEDQLPYFLGSIILSHPEPRVEAPPDQNGKRTRSVPPLGAEALPTPIQAFIEIVDGQQRLTTLTMLFAVLRDLETDPGRRDELDRLIALVHPPKLGQVAWRLTPGFFDRTYFETFVQMTGKTQQAPRIETIERDSWRRMAAAVQHFNDTLRDKAPTWRQNFSKFLLHRCFVSEVALGLSAIKFHVFRTMNGVGQRPQAHDLLKSALFQDADLNEPEAIAMSNRWLDWQNDVGEKPFEEMFGHIRTILDRSPRGEMLEGLRRAALQLGPRQFLQNYLPPYAEAYKILLSTKVDFSRQTSRISVSLQRMLWLDHMSWRPVALYAILLARENSVNCEKFFKALERLSFSMQLALPDREQRRKRYRKILDELSQGNWKERANGAVALTPGEKAKLRERLLLPMGDEVRKAMTFVVNDLLAPGEVAASPIAPTVEHFLPRRPDADSRWRKQFFPSDQDVQRCVNLLGNLVLAPESKNRRAARRDLADKLEILFENGAEFASCRELANVDKWDETIIRRRTERFARLIAAEWEL